MREDRAEGFDATKRQNIVATCVPRSEAQRVSTTNLPQAQLQPLPNGRLSVHDGEVKETPKESAHDGKRGQELQARTVRGARLKDLRPRFLDVDELAVDAGGANLEAPQIGPGATRLGLRGMTLFFEPDPYGLK